MTKIKLTDNLSLSQIIRGFWRLDTWELSTDELIDNMKSSIDLGVTSFDTAEIYADTLCESQIGEAFAKDPALRGKVELISKTGIYKQEINGESFGYYNTTYDRIVRSCKESLQRLHTGFHSIWFVTSAPSTALFIASNLNGSKFDTPISLISPSFFRSSIALPASHGSKRGSSL